MFHSFAWQLAKLHPRSYGAVLLLTLLGTIATLGQAYVFARSIDGFVVHGESISFEYMVLLGHDCISYGLLSWRTMVAKSDCPSSS